MELKRNSKGELAEVAPLRSPKENERLVLPTWHKEFMERYNYNIENKDENLLKCIFMRDWSSVIRTK